MSASISDRSTGSAAPSSGEAAASRLFSPLAIGPALTLSSRTWVPAMVPWRARADGHVSPDLLDWYGRLADGQPGAIVVEATGIGDVPSGPLLRASHDHFIPGLASIAEVIRARSGGRTAPFLQLIDFLRIRRRPEPQRFFSAFLVTRDEHRHGLARELDDPRWQDERQTDDHAVRAALFALPSPALARVLSAREIEDLTQGARDRITDVEWPHIRDLPLQLPAAFAAAAVRARRAGFAGVELHYAHAYTMASFLSPLNTRGDDYGGDRDGRLRLPLEVLAAARAAVGPAFALGIRFLGDEAIAGGHGPEDAAVFAVAFARAGADFLSLSRGGKFEDARQPAVGQPAYPYTGPSGLACMPTLRAFGAATRGHQLGPARAVRAAIRAAGFSTPVVAAGGLHDFVTAEGALARGDCDVVAAARQSLADPDWWRKLRLGHGAEIRRCTLTNYCEGLDQKHRKVTCKLWDRQPVMPGETVGTEGRRRLVAPPWHHGPGCNG